MKDLLHLEVITPDRMVLDEYVARVTLPESDGYITLLPGHAALVAELGAGELEFEVDGKAHWMAICGGFLEVRDNRVKVLANSALGVSEIDLDRARQAEERARERLNSGDYTIDYRRAASALHRAQTRLTVATSHMEH